MTPPDPPVEGTLEIRDPDPRPSPRPGAVRHFFFRSEEDVSGEELLPVDRPDGWYLERLRAALARNAQRVEQDGEVVWRVPWGILVECLGQVLEEMDRPAAEAPAVLEDAFRRAETAVETRLEPATPEAPPDRPPDPSDRADLAAAQARAGAAEARVAELEQELGMRAQEVRYLEARQGDLRQELDDAQERLREQEEELSDLQEEAAAKVGALEERLRDEQARAAGLEARLTAQAEELRRREERARAEEDRLQRELARLDGFLRAVAEELPPEGQGLPPGEAPTRLANLRALVLELEACARERRAGAALVPVPDLEGLAARLEGEPLQELLSARARFEPLLERARRGEARLHELLELVGLAQRWCAREPGPGLSSNPAAGT